jgi:hypothetical protein
LDVRCHLKGLAEFRRAKAARRGFRISISHEKDAVRRVGEKLEAMMLERVCSVIHPAGEA